MDRMIEETALIAARIRIERQARNWSLADLANRSGVSKATISKIEREELSPSAVILVRIAGAFDLTIAGLLLRAEGEKSRLTHKNEQPTWKDPETGYTRKQIFRRTDHPLEMVLVNLPPGKQLSYPAWTYSHIRQIIWLQKGELVVTEGTDTHVLTAGDCLGFGPPSDVTLRNKSKTPAVYVLALARV